MRTRYLAAMILAFASASLGACSWAGKTTGKAVNAAEQGAAEFERAYKKQRGEEDRRTSTE